MAFFEWASFLHYVVLPYTSGLLAAISPCLIIMVPVLLFRFTLVDRDSLSNLPVFMDDIKPISTRKRVGIWPVLQFVIGFQVSFLVFGFVLTTLLNSSIQNGFKLGMGGLFMVTSALSNRGLIDPLSLPVLDNTFLMGVVFAAMLSVNPCTVPFLAVIISFTLTRALVGLVLFAQGLLTPALVFLIIGEKLVMIVEHYINPGTLEKTKGYTAGLLLLAGASLSWGVDLFTTPDSIISALWIPVVALLAVSHASLAFPRASQIRRLLLVTALGLMAAAVLVSQLPGHVAETHAALAGYLTSPTSPSPSSQVIIPAAAADTGALPKLPGHTGGEHASDVDADVARWLEQMEFEASHASGDVEADSSSHVADNEKHAVQCVDMSAFPRCWPCCVISRLQFAFYIIVASVIFKHGTQETVAKS